MKPGLEACPAPLTRANGSPGSHVVKTLACAGAVYAVDGGRLVSKLSALRWSLRAAPRWRLPPSHATVPLFTSGNFSGDPS